MSKETILVVDDNHQITDFVAGGLLPGLGYQTLVAHNGKTARELIKARQPDLLLLDYQLPDTTGLEVLRQLVREGLSIPTILFTAEGSEQIAADAFRLGVQDYMIKPVDAEELNAAVARALTETRLRQEKTQLTARLKQQITWLMALAQLGQSVTAILELDEVLRRIVDVGVHLTNAEEGFIALLEDGQLFLRAAKHRDEDVSKSLRMPVSDSLASRVVQSGCSIRIPQAASEESHKLSTGFFVHSLIQVPILSKDRMLGVLSVDNRNHQRIFTETDETMLASLADYAAVAIENARLYQQAQQEIEDRKRAEEALRTYATKLEHSNRDLESFAYVVSHDLQEPLRKVQIFGDRLETKYGHVLDAKGLDYLERMRVAAARMQTLIRDVLTFSRVTTKGQPFAAVDLAEVARQVVSDLETRIEQLDGRVEIGDLNIIEADLTQMRQLLQNLISNGLKFHREGEPPFVKLRGCFLNGQEPTPTGCQQLKHSKGRLYQISVEDNGIGFEEKYLDRIFQVFQRLHGQDEYQGTGIGLAICRKIVERHGGSITARSTPGQGATFIVTLPVRQRDGIEAS